MTARTTRRALLLNPVLLGLGALPTMTQRAGAQRAGAQLSERAIGSPGARLVVQEWFSLTCTHCAHFSATAFPEVKAKLIDTGRIRYVFQDFPLDQLALAAAAVARALPADRYLPFIETLFATQDRWAFDRNADPIAELGRQATLAGMAPSDFQAVIANQTLRQAIITAQDAGQKRYDIQGTPTFIFGDIKIGPIVSYEDFAAAVEKASARG